MSLDEMRGRHVRDVVGEEMYSRIEPYIRRVLQGETVTFDVDQESNGVYSCDEVIYIPQLSSNGRDVVGFHVMKHDVTVKKLEERRLVHLAQIDSLSGRINRAGFYQRLSAAWRTAGRPVR